jgi:DNA-binding MarR family transcriptional regulator
MDPIFVDERWTTYGLFHEAARAVAAALEAEVPDELDAEVGSVLLQLARTPDERLRMVDLARAMSLHPSKVTRLVDRCERLGFVERIPCETDRRSLWASLTDAGRSAITGAAPMLLDALDRHYFSLLSDREAIQLAKLARRLRDAAHTRDTAAR